MKTTRKRATNWWKAWLLPISGIGFSYVALIDWPLRRELTVAQAQHRKLAVALERSHKQHAIEVQQLSALKQSHSHTAHLVNTQTTSDDSLPEPSEIESSQIESSQIKSTTTKGTEHSSLTRLSRILAIFDRHALTCVASQPLDSASEVPDSSAPAISAPASKSTTRAAASSPTTSVKQLQLTLQGSFMDMCESLEEIEQLPLHDLSIVSVEMQAAGTDSGNHRWILILETAKHTAL